MPEYLIRFDFNHTNVGRIATNRKSTAAVRAEAAKAKAYAESISPENTGAYKRSFGISTHVRRDWPDYPSGFKGRRYQNPRACADLFNNDRGATAIEVGGFVTTRSGEKVHFEGYRIFRQTIDHLSLGGSARFSRRATRAARRRWRQVRRS